jgi:hypothetical protein
MTAATISPFSSPADRDGDALAVGDVVTIGRNESPSKAQLYIVTTSSLQRSPLGYAVEIRRADGSDMGADYGRTRFLAGVCLSRVSAPAS